MNDPFSKSSGGLGLRPYIGQVGLFTPLKSEPGIKTKFDVVPIRADVVILDPNDAYSYEEISGMIIMNTPVVNELLPIIEGLTRHRMHVARIKEVENKKGGSNTTIVLDPPLPEDIQAVRDYLASLKPEDPFAKTTSS